MVEDFQSFVKTLDREPELTIFHDRHFRSQTRLLRDDVVPYSKIYKTAEFRDLMRDLEAHLRPFGLEQMPRLRRSNETPLLPVAPLFTPEVNATIEKHYAADFERYGYQDVVPEALFRSPEYTPELLAEVGRLVERGERIGDLYLLAQQREAPAPRGDARAPPEAPGRPRRSRRPRRRSCGAPGGKAGRIVRRGLRVARRPGRQRKLSRRESSGA